MCISSSCNTGHAPLGQQQLFDKQDVTYRHTKLQDKHLEANSHRHLCIYQGVVVVGVIGH